MPPPLKNPKIQIKPLNLPLNFLYGLPDKQGKKKPLRLTMNKEAKAKEKEIRK